MPISPLRTPVFPGGRASPVTYFPPATIFPSTTTGVIVAGRVWYEPAWYPGLIVDRLRIQVTVGSAGLARLGIYLNSGGVPGTLLVQGAAELDTTNIANVDASFTAVALPDDWVWFAAIFSATPTCIAGTPIGAEVLGAENLQTPRRALTVTRAYGALPASADLNSISFSGANAPIICAWKS